VIDMKQRIEVELFKVGSKFGPHELEQGMTVRVPETPFPVTYNDNGKLAGTCTEITWKDGVCKAVIELDERLVSTGAFIGEDDLEIESIVVPTLSQLNVREE